MLNQNEVTSSDLGVYLMHNNDTVYSKQRNQSMSSHEESVENNQNGTEFILENRSVSSERESTSYSNTNPNEQNIDSTDLRQKLKNIAGVSGVS